MFIWKNRSLVVRYLHEYLVRVSICALAGNKISKNTPLAPLQFCVCLFNVTECSPSITRAVAEVLKTRRFNLFDTI